MWGALFWQKWKLFTLNIEILAVKRKFGFSLKGEKKPKKPIGFFKKKPLGLNHGLNRANPGQK